MLPQHALSKEAPITLVPSFVDLLQPLSLAMTAPTFQSMLTLMSGWVFARRRTVTGMIVAAGAVGDKHHSSYHRFFSGGRWSSDELGLLVLTLILPLVRSKVVMLAVDDTLARKRGAKVFGVGMHHDPLLSSRKTTVTNWGHCWVTLGVVLKLPYCGDRWLCLPVLSRLYMPKKAAARDKVTYKTKPQLAVELIQLLCNHHKTRQFHAVCDSAYGGKSVLLNLPGNCGLTSRLVMDARLHEAPPERRPNARGGRPKRRGLRMPTPRRMLEGRCAHLTLDIYGRKDKSRVAECAARCYAAPERPLKVVAVAPLTGGRTQQAFYSTCWQDTAQTVLTQYACRWSLEVTYHDVKGQLGFEEPQSWTRTAVRRAAPMALLIYSLVTLWFAKEGHRHYELPEWPWYQGKTRASFADMLATLRRQCVQNEVSSTAVHGRGSRNLVNMLFHLAKLAA
jgi:hypothetical protein